VAEGLYIGGCAEKSKHGVTEEQHKTDASETEQHGERKCLTGCFLRFKNLPGAEHSRGKRTGADAGSDADGGGNQLNWKTDGKRG